VQPLAARLHGHSEARQPGFEADLVGNDPLQRGDVRRAVSDPIAIHIEADRKIEVRGRTKPPVEPEALEGVHRQPDARRRELDGVAQAFERLGQDVNPDVGAAAALDVQRSGSEESDSHLGYAHDHDTGYVGPDGIRCGGWLPPCGPGPEGAPTRPAGCFTANLPHNATPPESAPCGRQGPRSAAQSPRAR